MCAGVFSQVRRGAFPTRSPARDQRLEPCAQICADVDAWARLLPDKLRSRPLLPRPGDQPLLLNLSPIPETKIATLFVQTTNECPSNKQGPGTHTTPGCYPGSAFLQNRIASSPDLAQEANWGDVNALVGTMADQIVATIC